MVAVIRATMDDDFRDCEVDHAGGARANHVGQPLIGQ